jgi:DNA-binding LytR/AlgR family response regulator
MYNSKHKRMKVLIVEDEDLAVKKLTKTLNATDDSIEEWE